MSGIEGVLYVTMRPLVLGNTWLVNSVSFTHCLQRVTVLGANNFLTEGCRSVHTKMNSSTWEEIVFLTVCFLLFYNL